MKRKLLGFVIAFALVAGFIFAAGEQEETSATGMDADGPQYGGTITMFSPRFVSDPPSPDETTGQFNSLPFLLFIQEPLLMGDMETYGPRGTGDYAFQGRGYLPPEYTRGHLLESWEFDAEKITLNVRKGLYWQGTNKVKKVMENREVTAEDILIDINRFRLEAPWGSRFDGMIKDIYTTDRYTIVAEFDTYSSLFLYYIATEDRAVYAPPEMVEAGADKWENQVGTGPFVFEEYSLGSHMSFAPNPDYWRKATIDGEKYQIPFVDRLITPIIPDEATQMAALRTGKIDIHQGPPAAQWKTLDKTAPGILSASYSVSGMSVTFRVDEPPFDDLVVRQALNIGTDRNEFARLGISEDMPIHWFPLTYMDPNYYTPLDQLPEDIQMLYDYNPEKAKEMLAEAGYPDGFTFKANIGPLPLQQDQAALLKDQWAKIGVTVEIETFDSTTLSSMTYGGSFNGVVISGCEVVNPLNTVLVVGRSRELGGWNNWGHYYNAEFDNLMLEAASSLDQQKVNSLVKEGALILLRDCLRVPLYGEVWRHYWWPWLKNYYGELTIADEGPGHLMAYTWVDQSLKKEMGF